MEGILKKVLDQQSSLWNSREPHDRAPYPKAGGKRLDQCGDSIKRQAMEQGSISACILSQLSLCLKNSSLGLALCLLSARPWIFVIDSIVLSLQGPSRPLEMLLQREQS